MERAPDEEKPDTFGLEPRINTEGTIEDPEDPDAPIRGPHDDG